MTDIQLDIFEDGSDFVLQDGDLAITDGLVEAVLVSLFSDARASADDPMLANPEQPGGWCLEEPGDRFGSRIWLLANSPLSDTTATAIRDACTEALAWLRELDIAQSYEVLTEVSSSGDRLNIEIRIRRGTARAWPELWSGIVAGDSAQIAVGASRVRLLYA